jgi:hypothetical protein
LLVDGLIDLLEDCELGHGIWDSAALSASSHLPPSLHMEGSWIELHLLLEQDGTETSVESSETLVLQHLTESTNKSTGVCRLGNETNTGGLERAESNISEEFCAGRGDEVDGDTVVGGRLVANEIDGLLLEEFITGGSIQQRWDRNQSRELRRPPSR